MSEFLNEVSNKGDFIAVLAVAGFLLVSLTAVIGTCIYKIRRNATAAQLKQDMLDRGMSADEIKTVLEAGSK